jgi:FAD/FMN-containing dehydrogenase
MIKRREFCGSTLAALATATPLNRLLAAAAAPITGELAAVTGTGKQILLAKSDLEDLRAGLRGALLLSDDDGYDQARRAWNAAFDRHPALIARCAGAADVRLAVNFARAHELLVAVRGGGHSFSGQSVCDHGLMIDLSPMKGIRVDPLAKTASVAPGVLLGEFDREAQAFGLATTAGTVSHTGVSGLTLGGGFGRLCRKFGLAADNLQAVDIVTADGSFRRASSHENSDLFWGVRGGGGNFGVVTSLEFRLHPVGPTLLGGVCCIRGNTPETCCRSLPRSPRTRPTRSTPTCF